jgi:predicted aspartyl protease
VIELDIDLLPGLLMTDIDLWNRAKNKYSSMSIVIDTGASVTTISKDILFRAGYDVMAGVSKRITTASGIEYVKELVIDRLRLDDYEINDVLIYAHTFPQESFASGVLGLNVLSMFDVNILFSKKTIELTVI